MENKIKISIIIPTYNSQDSISRCLLSLIKQKLEEIEIFCIDDGSTDKTKQIISSFKKRDSRIKLIELTHNGVSHARNVGISIANGEYLQFIDSDDYIEPNTCEQMYGTAKKYNSDAVFFGFCPNFKNENDTQWVFDLDLIQTGFYKKISPYNLFNLNGLKPFVWNQIIKTSLIKKNNILFNENYDLGEDQIFQFNYLPYAKNVKIVNDKLYHYCKSNNSTTNRLYKNLSNKIQTHLDMLETIKLNFMQIRKLPEFEYQFIIWSINFLYGDLIKLSNNNIFCTLLYKFLISINYNSYYTYLPKHTKQKLKRLNITKGNCNNPFKKLYYMNKVLVEKIKNILIK